MYSKDVRSHDNPVDPLNVQVGAPVLLPCLFKLLSVVKSLNKTVNLTD